MSNIHEKPPKKHHTPHHVVPKHESGYTDEVAEECHDLIDRAEEEAHLHEPGSMYSLESDMPSNKSKMSDTTSKMKKKSGLEGTDTSSKSSSGMTDSKSSQSMGSKMEGMGESMKETMGSAKESMKETTGMKK